MIKFKLIHKQTGLTLRQYKQMYPISIYYNGGIKPSNALKDCDLKYIIREDGAIAVQRSCKDMLYDDNQELFFLKREDWDVVF